MKDFWDNLKAFAMLILALFRSDDDENKITAEEFVRAHVKKIFAVAMVCITFLVVSCGVEEKFFSIMGEEFMKKYNANISRIIPNAELVDRLKVDGVRQFKVADTTFVSLRTRQNYLVMEISAHPNVVNVHWSLNDGNIAHVSDFKVMSGVAAYSIDGNDDPELWHWFETTKVINALFTQFDRENLSPTITHKGITYSLSASMGDFGGSLKGESIWFTAKKSNK